MIPAPIHTKQRDRIIYISRVPDTLFICVNYNASMESALPPAWPSPSCQIYGLKVAEH